MPFELGLNRCYRPNPKSNTISAGLYHTCAQDDGGGVKNGVISIAAGAKHTCDLFKRGVVKCWVDNREGQLGNGSTQNRRNPVYVHNLSSSIQQLTAAVVFSWALAKYGSVICRENGQDGKYVEQ